MTAGAALVVRLDNLGDVLLTGPAVRAVTASGARVTMLCGPSGRSAASLLPGVAEVWEFRAPWIDIDGHPVDRAETERLVGQVEEGGFDEAIVMTSFHQSALPTALLLRLAGVPTIAANSVDHPGSLLDVRHLPDEDVHEVERNLALVGALGHTLPAGDDGRLGIVRTATDDPPPFDEPYVVVHPGATAPARTWSAGAHRAAVGALVAAGWPVAVTGGPSESPLTHEVAAGHDPGVRDLGGTTSLAGLGEVIAGAAAVVVGNTGAAHLAAAVGTPVVSVYAPTVPAARWRPWRVPHVLLGDQDIPCRGCRARTCPVEGHPCLAGIRPEDVVAAVASLTGGPPGPPAPAGTGLLPLARGAVTMDILLWHVHGSWTTAFVQGSHRYHLPVDAARSPWGLGRARTWDWPATVTEVTFDEARDLPVDLVVLQRPEELAGLAERWLGGRRPGVDVAAVYLEHNAPQGRVAEMIHPAVGRPGIVVVHVTPFNDLFWDCGPSPTVVIEHGIVDPGLRYTGELARSVVVVNEPVRRGRVTGTDLLERFATAGPLDVFGIGAAEIGGVEDLPQDLLHREMARRRVYVHPVRWTSLGLALLEAMHLGMPVVALATTEVVEAVPAAAGIVSTSVDRLVDETRRLLADRDAAREMGEQARAAATARYGLKRFLADWDELIAEVT